MFRTRKSLISKLSFFVGVIPGLCGNCRPDSFYTVQAGIVDSVNKPTHKSPFRESPSLVVLTSPQYSNMEQKQGVNEQINRNDDMKWQIFTTT